MQSQCLCCYCSASASKCVYLLARSPEDDDAIGFERFPGLQTDLTNEVCGFRPFPEGRVLLGQRSVSLNTNANTTCVNFSRHHFSRFWQLTSDTQVHVSMMVEAGTYRLISASLPHHPAATNKKKLQSHNPQAAHLANLRSEDQCSIHHTKRMASGDPRTQGVLAHDYSSRTVFLFET